MRIIPENHEPHWNDIFTELKCSDSDKAEILYECMRIICDYQDACWSPTPQTMAKAREERNKQIELARKLAKSIKKSTNLNKGLEGTATDRRTLLSTEEHQENIQADVAMVDNLNRWIEQTEGRVERMNKTGSGQKVGAQQIGKLQVGNPVTVLIESVIPIYEEYSRRKARTGTGPFFRFCTALFKIADKDDNDNNDKKGLEGQIRRTLERLNKKPS